MTDNTSTPSPDRPIGILPRADGATIAYRDLPGAGPTIVFIHGLKSDMEGGKALALEEYCARRGNAFVRLDLFGHGKSSGRFEEGTIGRWADDLVALLDQRTEGPVVLVGSSMGGWVMLLAALRRPERVIGLMGIAVAPDFTEELLWSQFDAAQRQQLLRDGVVVVPSDYDSGYPISRALIEDGRQHLLLGDRIAVACPVRLIHGMRDKDVPWQTSLRLQDHLAAEDVEVILVKHGDHRLSTPEDLGRMCAVMDGLLKRLAQSHHDALRPPS